MLKLTPDRLAVTYAYLLCFPPFSRWRMPAPEKVRFWVMNRHNPEAEYRRGPRSKNYTIGISQVRVGHLQTLLINMAHEMIHVYQDVARTDKRNTPCHNAEFHRLARIVCARFGWDPRNF